MTLHDDDSDDDDLGNNRESCDYRDGNNGVDGYDDKNAGKNNFGDYADVDDDFSVIAMMVVMLR